MASDVIGVPLEDALFQKWTPVAQVYGFDTMSETRIDAQGFEEQAATAEALAARALAIPSLSSHCPPLPPLEPPSCNVKSTYSSVEDFSNVQGKDCWSYLDSDGVPMIFDAANSWWKRNHPDQSPFIARTLFHPGASFSAVRRWTSPVDGLVTVSGEFVDTDPRGGDGVDVSILKNGNQMDFRTIPNGGNAVFSFKLTMDRGDRLDFIVNGKAFHGWDSTALTATLELKPFARKRTWTWANCSGALVGRVASRAFRRPLRPDEREDYRALYESTLARAAAAGIEEPVDEALSTTLQAVFLSPNFMFKPELVRGGFNPDEQSYGVASRLGLYFRGSVADEPLWAAAASGTLTSKTVVAHATRLANQDLPRFAANFGGQWLDFRDQRATHPLGEDMRREASDVFVTILREGLPAERLLSPGFTIVSGPLASLYGFSGVPTEATAARVASPSRGGVLSQAHFLARTGEGSEFRRPIHRGLWVLSRLLCRPLPQLDPATLMEIGNSFEALDRSRPLPEQMAKHRDTSTRCGACHNQIDPVGIALEKYDRVGRWRDFYEDGQAIESTLDFGGQSVRDPIELTSAIERSPEFRACVAEKLLTFALNRSPREDETCWKEKLTGPITAASPSPSPSPSSSLRTMSVEALVNALTLSEASP